MILLEVVLAVALFVIAAAVVGSAIRGSIAAAEQVRLQNRAVNLAQSKMAELAAGIAEINTADAAPLEEAAADGENWTCQTLAETLPDSPGITKVTVIIRNDSPRPAECRLSQWLYTPTANAATSQSTEGAGQ